MEEQRVKLVRRSRTAFEEWLTDLRPWNVRQTLTFSGSLGGREWLPSEAAAVRRAAAYGMPRRRAATQGRPYDTRAPRRTYPNSFRKTTFATKSSCAFVPIVLPRSMRSSVPHGPIVWPPMPIPWKGSRS